MLDGEQIGSLIYLLLLAVVIGGWVFVSNRKSLGKLAQYAAIWMLIFLGAVVAVGLWNDVRDEVMPRQSLMMDGESARVEVPRASDGHYYLTLDVNGAPIRFVVDTGATDLVLSREDATRAGIALDSLIFSGRAATANGMVETARVRLASLRLGDLVETDVGAVVNSGAMPDSLLGMAYLQRFERLEIADGRLVLER